MDKWELLMKYSSEIIDLANHWNSYTTSDLQARAEAIVLSLIREVEGGGKDAK